MLGLPEAATTGSAVADASIGVFLALIMMLLMFVVAKAVRRRRAVRLAGPEVCLALYSSMVMVKLTLSI